MAHPEQSWGKGQTAYVRYERGRITEEDESIESETPHTFAGKDEIRSTPRPVTTSHRKKRRLPRPSKNEPEISKEEAYVLQHGSDDDDYAQFHSAQKQRQLACIRRGFHDWRRYQSYWTDKPEWHYVCADCGGWEP